MGRVIFFVRLEAGVLAPARRVRTVKSVRVSSSAFRQAFFLPFSCPSPPPPIASSYNISADRTIVTTDGDHTSVEVIVGLIHTYRRDMLCLNNSVMDTIIICPEAVIIGR